MTGPKPRTFADLNDQLNDPSMGLPDACRRCGKPATHSVSVTVMKLGSPNGVMAARRKSRLCEACTVALYAPIAKALR